MISAERLRHVLASQPSLVQHPQGQQLLAIATGPTDLSSGGFPFISQSSFELFLEQVPHLFLQGQSILDWVRELDQALADQEELSGEEIDSLARAMKVIRTMVLTAAVTAPPDLWLLRQVLSVHQSEGILPALLQRGEVEPEAFAEELGLQAAQLQMDFHFLHARGYLQRTATGFRVSAGGPGRVLRRVEALPESFRQDWVDVFCGWFQSETEDPESRGLLQSWLQIPEKPEPTGCWVAGWRQMEIGYRMLPLVVAMKACNLCDRQQRGNSLSLPRPHPGILPLLQAAGALHGGKVTALGARMFSRGPGPYGIIATYHPYLTHLEKLLRADGGGFWVQRAANVAASQAANQKSFTAANDALDRFCRETGFRFKVFIEHAIGKGEATRQRFVRSAEEELQYVGADLEDASIDEAIKEQAAGRLPANMRFLRKADIGQPALLLEFLAKHQIDAKDAVMMVGNGFHEIRDQSNEKMIEVFREYQQAGILLIFTEESGLSDQELLETAWNTYHAGFRYVHELSGQGLRPAWESETPQQRFSWAKCASLAGYRPLDSFSRRSRRIFPVSKDHPQNPAISVTHFCIPKELANRLGE
ncbi:MAG: hypothetical protein DWQ01_02255 [Planctomycetota bacterium]|nr:MAG: hypothetical protein DWQ01_02255 [Planctomycetota bacterium]